MPPQPWTISKPETPRGTVKNESLKSTIQGIERTFFVYVPANYKADELDRYGKGGDILEIVMRARAILESPQMEPRR